MLSSVSPPNRGARVLIFGGKVIEQQSGADKPRRALQASPRRLPSQVLTSLLRRGLAVIAVSGIGFAGLATFTASASNSAADAYAVQTPVGIASMASALGEPEVSADDLADGRNQSINTELTQIDNAVGDAAMVKRFQALGADAIELTDENKRLKHLSEFQWPTHGKVSSVFGMRLHPILHYYRMHDGDDIGGTCGQPIWAAQSGKVTITETGYNGGSGNNVWIDHGNINGVQVSSGYLHMSSYTVKVGQHVDKGDVIGYVGNTGLSTACHLHFSIKKNGAQSDPMQYIGWNYTKN
ncbi:MAG TPA: hypothetical protein DCM67_08470 [Propionibacteriaceae bacterium]|nr:hypothetical protein [Propionibacteriaceae bacterium]